MRNAQDRHIKNHLAMTNFLELRTSSFYLACFHLTATSLFLNLNRRVLCGIHIFTLCWATANTGSLHLQPCICSRKQPFIFRKTNIQHKCRSIHFVNSLNKWSSWGHLLSPFVASHVNYTLIKIPILKRL